MFTTQSDSDIIEAYLSGRKWAVDRVDQGIRKAFSSWQERLGKHRDDIRSDVHFKLLKSLRKEGFALEKGLMAFVSGIVRHTCLDYHKAIRRFAQVDIGDIPILDGRPNPHQQMEKNEIGWLYFRTLRQMSKQCLKLFRAIYHDGLKPGEIAARDGEPAVRVRVRLNKCRATARRIRDQLLKEANDLGYESP